LPRVWRKRSKTGNRLNRRCVIFNQRPRYFRDRSFSKKDRTRINNGIRAAKVRLIDEEGNPAGVVDIRAAMQKAGESGLDLVEVAPNADPPVCRIMDYGKYRFEQEKREKLAKKKQHVVQIKEVRFNIAIEEHDYQVKLKHIREFLEEKNKVRVTLRFRGRQMAHKEIGRELIARIATDISPWGEVESSPKWMGKTLSITVLPKK
jgi:translation initiation factor IF-3